MLQLCYSSVVANDDALLKHPSQPTITVLIGEMFELWYMILAATIEDKASMTKKENELKATINHWRYAAKYSVPTCFEDLTRISTKEENSKWTFKWPSHNQCCTLEK